MSDILHEDTFHGTKKGDRRKTVSKRRAYVNTPRNIVKVITNLDLALKEIQRHDKYHDTQRQIPYEITNHLWEARRSLTPKSKLKILPL